LINKGPHSIDVVRLARNCGALAVMGNHEESVLRAIHRRRAAALDKAQCLARRCKLSRAGPKKQDAAAYSTASQGEAEVLEQTASMVAANATLSAAEQSCQQLEERLRAQEQQTEASCDYLEATHAASVLGEVDCNSAAPTPDPAGVETAYAWADGFSE
jgi:hypothetical protein